MLTNPNPMEPFQIDLIVNVFMDKYKHKIGERVLQTAIDLRSFQNFVSLALLCNWYERV